MARRAVHVDPLHVVRAFVDDISHASTPVFVGIDPGASGAIACLCGRRVAVIDIPATSVVVTRTRPTTKKERKATGRKTKRCQVNSTRFDHAGICAVFRILREIKGRITIALEQVPTSLGPGRHHAEIVLNRAYAMWPLFLFSKNYSVVEFAPNVWKPHMGLASKDKEASRLKALALFPRADIVRKEDHDRAEAILLAVYAQRQYAGKNV